MSRFISVFMFNPVLKNLINLLEKYQIQYKGNWTHFKDKLVPMFKKFESDLRWSKETPYFYQLGEKYLYSNFEEIENRSSKFINDSENLFIRHFQIQTLWSKLTEDEQEEIWKIFDALLLVLDFEKSSPKVAFKRMDEIFQDCIEETLNGNLELHDLDNVKENKYVQKFLKEDLENIYGWLYDVLTHVNSPILQLIEPSFHPMVNAVSGACQLNCVWNLLLPFTIPFFPQAIEQIEKGYSTLILCAQNSNENSKPKLNPKKKKFDMIIRDRSSRRLISFCHKCLIHD